MESSIPKKSNCSFISSKWTDFLAFIVGFIIILGAYKYDDLILSGLGGAIIVEHMAITTKTQHTDICVKYIIQFLIIRLKIV